jgi:uncharacterized protein YpmB
MKQIHIILIVFILFIVILLLSSVYLKKEKFTLNNNFDSNISEIEKKIKLLEFTMTSMKDNNNSFDYTINEKKPYKSVYNFY